MVQDSDSTEIFEALSNDIWKCESFGKPNDKNDQNTNNTESNVLRNLGNPYLKLFPHIKSNDDLIFMAYNVVPHRHASSTH